MTDFGADPALAKAEPVARLGPSGFDPGEFFSSRERYEIGAMLAAKECATGPICQPLGDWLVAMAQRTWPRLSGLGWFKKTNSKRRWSIVSYHHPARLCWSWSLHVTLFCKGHGPWWKPFRYSQCHARIPYLIEISWMRQSYDWMLSSAAERRLAVAALYQPRREPEVSMKEAML